MNNSDIRSSVDDRNETLGRRIRETLTLRMPLTVIVGEKEQNDGTVSVRRRNEDLGTMPVEKLIEMVKNEIREELMK